ncbi:pentatricopeptide repeat-containing protein At4g30700 [Fagus crenata]
MICTNIGSACYAVRGRNFFLDLLNKANTLSHVSQTHAQIILHGLHHDLSTLTKLIHKLSDFKAIHHARLLFLSTPKPDLFLFNVLIKGFSTNHSPSSAISLYTHLRTRTNLKPDNFTYAFAISAASGFDSEKLGLLLHSNAVVDGLGFSLFVGSAAVDLYFKFSRVEMARKVFDLMPEKDTILWNTMVSGLVRNCCYGDSIVVFRDMVKGGVGFDTTTLATVLPAAAELQELGVGTGIQCLALKVGYDCDEYVITGLVSLYSKCGEIDTARWLFGQIGQPDLVSCNAMISGYTCNGETGSSVRLFSKLLVSGQKVNSSTLVGLIPVFSPFGYLQLSCCIHGFCVKSGVVSHASVSTALTTVYSRLNEIESARLLFDETPEKSLASWNAMISGYTQNGFTEMAISLFREMMLEVRPNPVTITSILSACAQLGALSLGKWVHGLIKSENLESNIYVSTALIDMYAKCGSIVEARRLFDLMMDKNVVTWNAIISGYGLHGHGNEAINLFNEMLHSRLPPTGVTFLCVLYACSHAGLVRNGNEIFHSMVHDYGCQPLPEHYACMVDILGRAGQLNEALKFIEKMPVEPGPAVWGALLGACMIHKDTNLAHMASERLFKLDPENVGYHVLLSNIYSADRNFLKAASVRQVVKKRKLAKTPGCTLIEVGETPHVFTSGDQSHPQATAIYKMLEKLTGKMREAGFQSETVTALHDVEEEEKELMVKVHSEKLAIAFGLISTEPGTEIRIIKNLRVCLDCHNATKFISKITERVIVVRDANRFHRFEDGVCSCGDYW